MKLNISECFSKIRNSKAQENLFFVPQDFDPLIHCK